MEVSVDSRERHDRRSHPAPTGMVAAYRTSGLESTLWPRLAGSWPGSTVAEATIAEATITGATRKLPAGMDGAPRSFVDLFYALA